MSRVYQRTVKNLRATFNPWVGKTPWRRKWQLMREEFHRQRSLAGYGPWSCKESERTERPTLSISDTHINSIYAKIPPLK